MKPETLTAAQTHALEEYPRESCGLVVAVGRKEVYIPCENFSSDPLHDFVISKEAIVAAEEQGEITTIVHSHPDASPLPSDYDKRQCEAYGVEWLIIAVHRDPAFPEAGPYIAGRHVFAPSGYKPPLRGRSYVFGTQDCYTLVQDYYSWELGIELPDFPREDLFWERGEELYLENFAKAGFAPIEEPSQKGDLILMSLRSQVVNHGAIWLAEGNDILHHPYNHLSERTVYGGYWAETTRLFIRKVK